jgi:hypothetical protein
MAADRGLLLQPLDHLCGVIGDLAERLPREDFGVALASATVSGSSGQLGVTAA